MTEQVDVMAEVMQAVNKTSREYRIAMTEFNDAAKRREQFSLRAERRATYWLRLSMGGLFLLVILVLFLMFILTQQTQSISAQMTILTQHVGQTAQQLEIIQTQQSISNPQHATISFPDISPSLKSIEEELQNLNTNMAQMTNELKTIAKKTNIQRTQPEQPVYIHPYAYPYRR